jgi:hypothetical protein
MVSAPPSGKNINMLTSDTVAPEITKERPVTAPLSSRGQHCSESTQFCFPAGGFGGGRHWMFHTVHHWWVTTIWTWWVIVWTEHWLEMVDWLTESKGLKRKDCVWDWELVTTMMMFFCWSYSVGVKLDGLEFKARWLDESQCLTDRFRVEKKET